MWFFRSPVESQEGLKLSDVIHYALDGVALVESQEGLKHADGLLHSFWRVLQYPVESQEGLKLTLLGEEERRNWPNIGLNLKKG